MNIKTSLVTLSLSLFFAAQIVHASELRLHISAKKQRSTEGVIVELVSENSTPMEAANIQIEQQNKEFIPLLSITPKGSKVTFNNLDALKHHVYSVSQGNQFELPLHNGESPETISLDAPGIVKLGCNIHDWMLAYIYVSESEYIQMVDASGRLTFSDLPAGEYQIRVWSPRLRNTKKPHLESIFIGENETLSRDIRIKLRKRIRKPQRSNTPSNYSSGQ